MQQQVSTISAMYTYPPLFFLENGGRFNLDHTTCSNATVCVDMKGNTGGSYIRDIKYNAYQYGIDIVGSADTVRIEEPHWYVFNLSAVQQPAFETQGPGAACAIHTGRMDDLQVDRGLFFGGTAICAFQGTGSVAGSAGTGPTFGTITNTDFDTFSGINMSAGNLTCAACIFTIGNPNAQAVNLAGNARLHLAAPMVGIGVNPSAIPIVVAGTGAAGVPFLTWSGGEFDYQAYFDQTAVVAGAGAAPQASFR